MKVACLQFYPSTDHDRNLRTLIKWIHTAHQQDVDILVMPELATSPYTHLSVQSATQYAEDLRGRTVRAMQVLAQRYGMILAIGLMERDVEALYNTQMMVGPDGMIHSYRKLNLYSTDWIWGRPGTQHPPVVPFTINGISYRIGMLICRDIRNKDDDDDKPLYGKDEVDLVLFSAGFGAGAFPATAWMSFVKSTNSILLVSNRHGQELPNDFGMGGSGVVMPNRTIITDGLELGKDCLVIGEI